jgi:crotonobetainyl-CoA:carnitine CoA-transferase CaiB-like acyl-CoA transferase
VSEAVEQPWLAPLLPSTSAPDGRRIRLPPSVCGEEPREYAFAPRAGEHTESVLREAGLSPSEIEELTGSGAAMAAVER